MDCGMPELYIQSDITHSDYQILATEAKIFSMTGKWHPINFQTNCDENNC